MRAYGAEKPRHYLLRANVLGIFILLLMIPVQPTPAGYAATREALTLIYLITRHAKLRRAFHYILCNPF